MPTDPPSLSRKAWGDLEALHVVGYFSPDVSKAYVALGLHPQLSYFAARSAAFGPVGPGVSVPTFYVFAPWLHEATLPAAWDIASPDEVQRARRTAIHGVLRGILGSPDLEEALAIARDVCAGLTPAGRPLYAAHAALSWPEEPLLALWHAATLIREHRGDGHVATLLTMGLDPVESLVLGGVYSGNTDFLRKTRGWSDEEWAAGVERLTARGLLEAPDALSEEGRVFRQEIEDRTDALAQEGWAHAGPEATARLHELVGPLRARVLESGVLPGWIAARG